MRTIATLTLVLLTLGTAAYSQPTSRCSDSPAITVSGEAVVNVKPDKIVITFGIETSEKEIMAAKKENNDILRKTLSALKDRGIDDKEMQTDHLSIEPRWKRDYQKENFIGYFVRNTLVVTLKEPKKIEDVVTEALLAGVNYVHGVDFQTTDLQKYREEARELALEAAEDKAQKMAKVLGQSISDPIQIVENPQHTSSYFSNWRGRSAASSVMNVQVDRGDFGGISESIALGKLAIRASVSVTFELK